MKQLILLTLGICLLGMPSVSAQAPQGSGLEQVFVDTDKQIYVTGETVWMSFYCLDAASHVPSPISVVGYLEILDESANPIAQQKVQLREGRGHTQFFIDPTIPTAVYYLRAYTQWMRNGPPEAFFEMPLVIVNPALPPATQTPDTTLGLAELSIPSPPSLRPIQISLPQQTYGKREAVSVNFTGLEKTASLSVSVHKISADSSNWHLPNGITPYPKGIGSLPANALSQALSVSIPPEMRAPTIRGKVKGKRPQNLQVSFPGKHADMYSFPLQPDGQFQIEVSPTLRQQEMLFWSSQDTLEDLQVSLVSPFVRRPVVRPIRNFLPEDWRGLFETYSRNTQIGHLYVTTSHIRGTLAPDPMQTLLYDEPEVVYMMDDFTRFPSVNEVFLEYIDKAQKHTINGKRYLYIWDEYQNSYSVSNSLSFDTAALTLIDGVPILNPDFFWEFDVLKLEQIHISTKRYFAGESVFAGIVHFMTYDDDFGGESLPPYLIRKPYVPIPPTRSFYLPDYADPDARKRIPDYRNTLYWNPTWEPEPGHSQLSFYTGDGTGWYQVEVTGINAEGQALYGIARFEVLGEDEK